MQREIFIRGSRSSNLSSNFLKALYYLKALHYWGGVEAVGFEIFGFSIFSLFVFSTI